MFSESTGGCIGIETTSSAVATTPLSSPPPSPPSQTRHGPRRSVSDTGVPSRGTAASTRSPRASASARTSSRVRVRTTGSRTALPIEPRRAFHPYGSAPPTVMTPVAPPASTARMTAPVLPGSCTPSNPTTSGCGGGAAASKPTGRSVASATKPLGVETGLSASITAGETRTSRVRAGSSWSRTGAARCAAPVPVLTAARSIGTPAASASSIRRGPSSRTVEPVGVAERVISRNRATIGLRRLVICSTTLIHPTQATG